MVHHVCYCLPHVSVLNQISPVLVLHHVSCISVLMLPTLLCLGLPNVVFPFMFLEQKKNYVQPLSPCMLHTPHISWFVWSLKQYFLKSRDYKPRHNVILFISLLPSPFKPRYHSQHPILIHPQPVFLPPFERSILTRNANIIGNHLWNGIMCFILKSSHFSQVFDEGTIYDQLLCQYQHRWLSVISSVWRNNLERRMLDKTL